MTTLTGAAREKWIGWDGERTDFSAIAGKTDVRERKIVFCDRICGEAPIWNALDEAGVWCYPSGGRFLGSSSAIPAIARHAKLTSAVRRFFRGSLARLIEAIPRSLVC
jgi:hypothetical protein